MDIVKTLTSFSGRLNRKPYWIASLILLAVVIIAFLAITVVAVQTMQPELVTWPSIILQVAIAYFGSAIMAKRFQDRSKSGAWVLVLIVPVFAVAAAEAFGLLGAPISLAEIEGKIDLEAGFFTLWGQSLLLEAQLRPLDFALDMLVLAIVLWFLVELGFFRGTRGANAYGPDPLAAAA